jgi:hypothetical protein
VGFDEAHDRDGRDCGGQASTWMSVLNLLMQVKRERRASDLNMGMDDISP